jgi:hypothetical protein
MNKKGSSWLELIRNKYLHSKSLSHVSAEPNDSPLKSKGLVSFIITWAHFSHILTCLDYYAKIIGAFLDQIGRIGKWQQLTTEHSSSPKNAEHSSPIPSKKQNIVP